MGHSESKQTAPAKTVSPQIQVINEQLSTKFGKVKLVRETFTGREMYLKKIVSHNSKLHHTQLIYYYNRVQTYHPNLVNVIGYTTDEQKSFCSERYTIDVYLDPLNHTMQDTLDDHIKEQNFISEVQLQLLAQHMITVLAELQIKDIAHGEIKPANIFYNEEAYKLVDPTFDVQKGINGLVKYLVFEDRALLAPEVLKQVPNKDHELRTNKFKADVFSLGATLLSLATLTNSEELYNYEKGVMNYQLLESRIELAENFYSLMFTDLIRELLTIEEYRRPDFLQLKDKLHIGDILKSYNDRSPVHSYVKDPLVKIAGQISSETNSPVISPVKVPVKEPLSYKPTDPFSHQRVFYSDQISSESNSPGISPVKVPAHSVLVKEPLSYKPTDPFSDQKVFYSSSLENTQHIFDQGGESLKRNYFVSSANKPVYGYAQKNF